VKPEDRTIQPLIFDVLDATFMECMGQWNRRRKFYKDCGYNIQWKRGETEAENTVVYVEEAGEAVEAAEAVDDDETPKDAAAGHGFLLTDD
jgi:hypothetical protein